LSILLRAPRGRSLLYAVAVGILAILFTFALAYLQSVIVSFPR
jgi:hypothetical protein